MKTTSIHRSFASLLVVAGLAAAVHMGCDGGGGGGGGGVGSAACSSCQQAFSAEDCKTWGDRAGCEESSVSEEETCMAGIAGCSFKSCKGAPICDDLGEANCASCDGDLSQADCDEIGDSAGCTSATTGMFNACGADVVGCNFEGCDFRPSCP